MLFPPGWRRVGGAAALIAASGACTPPARAQTVLDVIQMMADAAAIDGTCRTTNTLYGAVFRYGEQQGVARDSVLLSGDRRGEFEAALARRLAATPPEELCGSLQQRYRETFPDWFRSR